MKRQFLEELKRYLGPLSLEERNEIIRFYEERFETGLRYEGKSEQEIIDELESPKQIARNVLEEYGYSLKVEVPEESSSNEIKLGSIVGLVLFDIFLATFLVPLLFGLFVGFGSSLVGFVGTMILLPFIESSVNLPLLLFGVGFGFLWFLFVLWLWDVLIGFITWLIRWHLEVFKYSRTRHVVRKLRTLRVNYWLRRSPRLLRTKNVLAFLSVILMVGGMIAAIVQFGTLSFDSFNEPLVEERYDFTLDEDQPLIIETNVSFANTTIRKENVSEMIVRLEYYGHPIELDFNQDNYNLLLSQDELSIQRWFSIGSLFRFLQSPPSIEIIVPLDVDIDNIDLTMSSGRVIISNVQANDIKVTTMNGAIDLTNIEANDIDVRTSNGRIDAEGIDAENIRFRTSNGKIILFDVQALEYELNTSNGNIELNSLSSVDEPGQRLNATTSNGSVLLDDVYVLDVRLRTSNGNIRYHNLDLTFILSRLDAVTTNGSKEISVPYSS